MKQEHIERFAKHLEISRPVTQDVLDRIQGRTFEGGRKIKVGDKVLPVIHIVNNEMKLVLFHQDDIKKYEFVLHPDDKGQLFMVSEIKYSKDDLFKNINVLTLFD